MHAPFELARTYKVRILPTHNDSQLPKVAGWNLELTTLAVWQNNGCHSIAGQFLGELGMVSYNGWSQFRGFTTQARCFGAFDNDVVAV